MYKRQIREFDGNVKAKIQLILDLAGEIAAEELESCRLIGEHWVGLMESISQAKSGETVKGCHFKWFSP